MANVDLGFDDTLLAGIGNRVVGVAQATMTTMTNIENEINSLGDSWKGKVDASLMNNINNEIGNIKRLLESYESTGQTITTSANNFGETRDSNAAMVNSVKYDNKM